jgi:uncharacterized membrane protein YjgN (DUF898 family)
VQSSIAEPAGATPATPVHAFAFHGTGGNLFLLILKNLFLTVITFGLYAAWARAERRKYLWSNTEISGHRLTFTGTGLELFKGYLKLMGFYVIFIGAPVLAERLAPGSRVFVQIGVTILVLLVVPFAIYWSRAYLLSRTQWRGVRFGLIPGAGPYAKTFILGYLATLLTFGLYGPVWLNKCRTILMNNMRYGSEPFVYQGEHSEAFRIGIKGFFLSILTLGIYSFWYRAQMQRFILGNTTFMRARGRCDLTGGNILEFTVLAVLGTALTLGLAFPWIATYIMRETLARVSFHGEIDFAPVAQRMATGDATSDALADGLGVDLAL